MDEGSGVRRHYCSLIPITAHTEPVTSRRTDVGSKHKSYLAVVRSLSHAVCWLPRLDAMCSLAAPTQPRMRPVSRPSGVGHVTLTLSLMSHQKPISNNKPRSSGDVLERWKLVLGGSGWNREEGDVEAGVCNCWLIIQSPC